MVAVTGATGHLGAALVRELLAAGEKVRAIVREGSDLRGLEGLSVELRRAELGGSSGGKDGAADGLEHAFASCDLVYHAAARISFGPEGGKALRATNVEGTLAALRAASCRSPDPSPSMENDRRAVGLAMARRVWASPAELQANLDSISVYIVPSFYARQVLRRQGDEFHDGDRAFEAACARRDRLE